MARRALAAILAFFIAAPVVLGVGTEARAAPSLGEVQEKLKEKGFYRGAINGVNDAATQQAVMAFRKEIGTSRSFYWSSSLWDELNDYVRPWTPYRYDEPDRVEVNLTRQVMYLFKGGALEGIFPVSSGNGEPYENKYGSTSKAYTPTGDFNITWHVRGVRESYLGILYNPWYFKGGYALHGSPSVPSYPASHGCVRLTQWDSTWLESRLFVGMPVHVWWEPRGKGPVLAPGGDLGLGGEEPCSAGTCDTVAFQDPSGRFYLWDHIGADPDPDVFWYGNPGDVPFSGDWDGDGVATLGLYRRSDGFVYLRNSNTQGVADISFYFGIPGDIPIAGDFDGDGFDTVSVFRPSEQRFYVINELGSDGEGLGFADYHFDFGVTGDRPFVGDFDGDGIDSIGLHRPSTAQVMLRNANSTGTADSSFVFGVPGDLMIAGDWNSDGRDTVAVFRPNHGVFYVKNSNSNGKADFGIDVGYLAGVVTIAR